MRDFVQIREILSPKSCHVGLGASSPKQILVKAAELIAEVAPIDRDAVAQLLIDREALGSTAVGNGCAIPHCRVRGIEKPACALILMAKPIDFGAFDDVPVDIVAVLIGQDSQPKQTLALLARMARSLRDERSRLDMRSARTAFELFEAFESSFI